MSIRLRRLAFDPTLISELEKDLLQNGFCLEDFTFEKNRRRYQGATYTLGIEYEYTVSIGSRRLSITFSDDLQFVRFLHNLCCTPEENGNHPVEHLLDRIFKRAEQYAEITKHWLMEDPFSSLPKKTD
jgi:hypothetical protein